jgi:hypothetical protein
MRPECAERHEFTLRNRTGAYNKDKLEVIYKCPFDGISVLLVLLFCCATLYESITDKAVDRGCRGRGQLGSLWGE